MAEKQLKIYSNDGALIQKAHHQAVCDLNKKGCLVSKIESVPNEDPQDKVGATIILYYIEPEKKKGD